MGVEELGRAHKLVSLLVTPTNTNPGSEKSWFLSILHAKNQEYIQAVESAVTLQDDDAFDYVRCCINALINLKFQLINIKEEEAKNKEEKKGPRLEADALSISQQKNIASLVELVLVLGILPNLIPGVGIPPGKRSQFLQHVIEGLPEKSIIERYKQLVYTLESVLDLTKHRAFNTLVFSKHTADILAALVQISNAPLMKPTESETVSAEPLVEAVVEDEEKFVMTSELHERLSNDQARFKLSLENIIIRNYQPTVIKQLLVLQGNAKDKKRVGKASPKWFTKRVSELLSERLIAEGGVANVIRGVLDMGGDDAEAMDWHKVNLVATVLGNPPEGNYASIEQYYAKICPQILALVEDRQDKVYQMIGCAAIKTVTERSLILSRRYLLDVLMEPLLKLADTEAVGLTVTEQEIDDCLKALYKIFVIGCDPDLMFLANLENVILILLEIHTSIALGISHLRDPVKQMVQRYLKHVSSETALQTVKAYVNTEIPTERRNRLKLLNKELIFGPGEEGGVKVLKASEADRSFYVTDDEKAIIIQDVFEDLKDKKLLVDFYMSLMADLTTMIVEDSKVDTELPETGDMQGMEEQLVALEATLDTSMRRMRKNLMVIRLLGLLSEDAELQENLLKESDRMIQFIGATLKRGAMTAGSGGEEDGVMATQSLNMALSILSLHLTQADVSVADWEKMQEHVSDLQVLSCHSDIRISRIAGQLCQLVKAQGAILEETKFLKAEAKKIEEATSKMKEKTAELKNLKRDNENRMMDEKKQLIKDRADNLQKAKDRRKKGGVKEEEKEMKILEDKTGMTEYESALYDITDPLLPVRGHGIITLTQLINAKDPETMEHIGKAASIFNESLEDDDTYIYLSAITGLVSCARYNTDQVLDTLTREFTMVYERKNLGDKAMEVRTKIGEALVQVTKELGELTPKYKNVLLNAFFSAGHDPDELVRASSLSNLGEVCRNLRFSLGGITGELMLHLDASSSDDSAQVRRAAAMVLTLMLEGLGPDTFSILEACLRDVHRSLRKRMALETDEVTLIHLNLALDQIDKIVKDLFSASALQTNKILMLD